MSLSKMKYPPPLKTKLNQAHFRLHNDFYHNALKYADFLHQVGQILRCVRGSMLPPGEHRRNKLFLARHLVNGFGTKNVNLVLMKIIGDLLCKLYCESKADIVNASLK